MPARRGGDRARLAHPGPGRYVLVASVGEGDGVLAAAQEFDGELLASGTVALALEPVTAPDKTSYAAGDVCYCNDSGWLTTICFELLGACGDCDTLLFVSCPAYCGDGVCNGGETCSSCSADCGPCPYCGDGVCNGGESCGSCATDCGACSCSTSCASKPNKTKCGYDCSGMCWNGQCIL